MDLRLSFNANETNYDRIRPDYPAKVFADIIEYASLNSQSKLLEIGTGTGQATFPFIKNGFDITGIELGDRLSAFCEDKFSEYNNFRIINDDFLKCEVKPKSFDLIYSATAFHWIPEDEGFNKSCY